MIRSLFFLTVFAFPMTLWSQQFPPEVETLDDERAGEVLFLNPEYLAYHPATVEAGSQLPLVIYLHGAGGLGSNIRKITGQSSGLVRAIERFGKGPCLVVAPQCQRESEKSELRGIWEPGDLNIFLAHLFEKFPYLDADRVYLTGTSMGGYGCWVWGGHSPEHFAAIAPIVGGIGRGGPKDVTPDIDAWAANLAKVPVYAFVGALDKVVPADRSERMIAAIKKAGGKDAQIKNYPDEGHGAGRLVFSSEAFFDWLFSQRRKPSSTTPDTQP